MSYHMHNRCLRVESLKLKDESSCKRARCKFTCNCSASAAEVRRSQSYQASEKQVYLRLLSERSNFDEVKDESENMKDESENMKESWTDRTELLLGKDKMQRLRDAHVLVVGVGGVGAYAAEMLCRAGIGEMTIIDADTVQTTNINRQLEALTSTVGMPTAFTASKMAMLVWV